jgi:HEAT repeat protein
MSSNPEDWQVAARDIAFVMGDDQTILLNAAYNHQDEHIRLSAAKILSRKRTPEARAVLEQMASDPNELVRSLVEKTLLINK